MKDFIIAVLGNLTGISIFLIIKKSLKTRFNKYVMLNIDSINKDIKKRD